MSAGADERLQAVRRLLAAARAVAADASVASELARTTGLSPQGVAHALAHHLEHDPTEAELASLMTYAGEAEAVLVILSANVFAAALRAIAIARAASARVYVRPSRREPTFARALVRASDDPSLILAEDFEPEALLAGEIHVYGRDETLDRVRARAAPGVRLRGHGAGFGVAWVSRAADLSSSARALADDTIAFDQRGCLSPRVALVEGDAARADAFAAALHGALGELQTRIPRGVLSAGERAQVAQYVALMQFAGHARSSAFHVVGSALAAAPLVLPPAARCMHVAPTADVASARELLLPFTRFIVAFGADDTSRAADLAPAHARLSRLGLMQHPPLDGPVDLR